MTEKKDKIVSEAVRKLKSANPDSFITLSTGVKLRTIRVPNMIFPEIVSRFEKPSVPIVYIADLGRSEENPNDPTYIEKFNSWQTEFSKAIVDTMIILGTEVAFVPDDVPPVDGGTWAKKLRILKLDPGDDESLRYLYWIKFIAAPSDEDIQSIVEGVGRLAGVSETDVSDAVDQFRNNA